MTYSTTDINSNFRIKVKGVDDQRKLNTLVGVSGLVNLIGEGLADKFVSRAFDSSSDKCVCRLRRGICVTFYVK